MKNLENLKVFAGGYYDDRIFKGEEFCGKTPFNKNINTYSLNEVLQLGFIENVVNWYNENKEENDKEFEELNYNNKVKIILNYVESDEIAGLKYFFTELEAENYKQEVLKELEELENHIEYDGSKQDGEGYYRETYIYK